MRVSTAAIYTLAALAANELSQAAIAQPVDFEPEMPGAGDVATSEPVVVEVVEAIAPPELVMESSLSAATPTKVEPTQVEPVALQSVPDTVRGAAPEAITVSAIAPETMELERSVKVEVLPVEVLPVEPPAQPEQLAQSEQFIVAQTPAPTPVAIPDRTEIEDLQSQLSQVEPESEFGDVFAGSPAITISNPSGYGADNLRGFVNASYQARTRYANVPDATIGAGIGLGDARESVGVQLSYTLASLGSNRDFGSGGFNAKVHRRLSDSWSVAAGWDGFLNLGDDNDFENTLYSSVTHIIRTTPDINNPLSRIALTAGVGNGRFRSEQDIQDEVNSFNVFGSAAIRVIQPMSAIVEWTGQDLAVGMSITPFPDIPWVITPAVRDLAGAGDGPRFVLGSGISFQF